MKKLTYDSRKDTEETILKVRVEFLDMYHLRIEKKLPLWWFWDKIWRVLLNPPTTDKPTTDHLITDPPTHWSNTHRPNWQDSI